MSETKTPGVWTTKATDEFTLDRPMVDATAACTRAGSATKGWKIEQTGPNRILVKNGPGIINSRSFHVEVLLADADGARTTCTLNGWTFGKGFGMKKMVRRAIRDFHAAIEAQ